ncbi:hypothetical protein CROQUDRAFT_198092 [Cronartium quercuum f. sp. fusiforme G11]|uniref:Uncharacterized protein n=1 Tax=Cronartium quercuum f. sp. fusiforme G11 TaxID=708437 RepID=A0A9P6TH58_9BASI|nr:hypothetical protein CROQUDRAFT_198092 [Cronartium quercuum f. sp. fusiforme G11]
MSLAIFPQLKPRLHSTVKFHYLPQFRNKPILYLSNSFSNSSTSQKILPIVTRANLNNRKTSGRVYPIRKQFIFEAYAYLFTQNQVCIFFRHENLTPKEWNSIRGQLAKLSADDVNNESKVQVQVLRTRMIGPVLKNLNTQSKIGPDVLKSLSPHLKGNLVCLSQRVFQPSRIQSAMKILSKHASVPTKAQIDQMSIRKPNQPTIVIDRLPFVMGIIDDHVQAEKARVEELSRLPTLESLRQQILGLISNTGARMIGTLNLGRGNLVVRTVDGYRATLEKQEHSGT